MRDWDDDEGPDPDYGVFGDVGTTAPRPLPSPEEVFRAARWRRQREAERKVSSDFNRHMIDLFNGRVR